MSRHSVSKDSLKRTASLSVSLLCACVRAWVRVPLSRWMIMYALWAVYHFTYSACDIFGQFIILGTEKVDLLTKSSYRSLSLLLKVSPCIKKKNLEFCPYRCDVMNDSLTALLTVH